MHHDFGFESICQIARAMFGGNEHGFIAAMHQVYFDESGTHDGSPMMVMAGYLFRTDQARKFSRDWTKELKKLNLEYAHMTDCALGYGQYANMSVGQRIDSEIKLIEHIKKRSILGISAAVPEWGYEQVMSTTGGWHQSAYTFMLMLCVCKISEYMREHQPKSSVAYFFESGHAKAGEANRFMNLIPSIGGPVMDYHRYAGHAFVDKRRALPLQAADMLAWQHRHYLVRRIEDGINEPRKDFRALARPIDLQVEVLPQHILAFRDIMKNANGGNINARIMEMALHIYGNA